MVSNYETGCTIPKYWTHLIVLVLLPYVLCSGVLTLQKYRTHLIVPVLLPHVLCSSVLLYRSTEPTWLFLYFYLMYSVLVYLLYRSTEPTWLFLFFYLMYSVLVYYYAEVQNQPDCSCISTLCTVFWCTYFTEVQNQPDCSSTSTSCTLFWCTTIQKYWTHLVVPVLPPHVLLCSGVLLCRSIESTCTSTSCTLFWCAKYYPEVLNPPDCFCTSISCTLFWWWAPPSHSSTSRLLAHSQCLLGPRECHGYYNNKIYMNYEEVVHVPAGQLMDSRCYLRAASVESINQLASKRTAGVT